MSTLETAILLASFLVIVFLFVFTMLGASLFGADQTSQTTVGGLERARSNVVTRGSVFATRGDVDVDGDDVINLSGVDRQAIVKLTFTVVAATTGAEIDLTPPYTKNDAGSDPDASGLPSTATMTVQTERVFISDAAWSVTFLSGDDGDSLLGDGERAEITIWLHPYDNVNSVWDLGSGPGDPYIDASASLLGTVGEFTVQVMTDGGAALTLHRTIPKFLDEVMNLN